MDLRKKLPCLALTLLALSSCETRKQVEPGIPLALAQDRKQSITNVQYDLFFDIPASRTDSIPARVTVRFDWKVEPTDLQLDFLPEASKLKSMQVNGRTASIRYENEHVLLDGSSLNSPSNTITIEFIAGEAALNRNDDYLYTLFVPSRASTCFPVFDQPDLKAVYRLELMVPAEWKAMSNGRVISSVVAGDRKRIQFSDTKATSSYQFAFAAGNFQEATDPVSGMTMYYRETDSVKVARNVSRIFELHRHSIAWLEKYTEIEYPYEKFDFTLLPAFQFGGMEHPGSIFYRESSLILEPSASINEELRRASLIAHETAHMWFGNLVTMQWFNDVWMKEVFANFMAAKMVSPSFPTINHDLRFLMAHYPSAYDIDRSAGAHPIQQPLDNLRNAGSVYGAIIYQKAPIMMRNLETWMGADNFKKGLNNYLKTYAYQNATWDDLVKSLKAYASEDLEVWNNAWIKTAGMPEIDVTQDPDGKKFLSIVNDSTGVVWPQVVTYRIKAGDTNVTQEVVFRITPRALLSKWVAPEMQLIPNYKGKGYGYFHASPEYLLSEVFQQQDVEVRAGIWMTLWEVFLRGEIPATKFFGHILDALEAERDPLLLEYLTDKTDRTFWQFLTPPERALASRDCDARILRRLAKEKDKSCQRTLFNVYRAVAISPDGIANLKKLWSDELSFGLELSERDHIQLAYALAVREVEGHEEILRQQMLQITNPDRKKEMEFVMPALSADPAVRSAFFERIKDKANRTREPWVLEAIRYLHHPLRAETSVQYVYPSLLLLEELQRTGDIFFPKGWLDATLAGHQSKEAADAVLKYLEENKSLRQDLRNKLLQSSDMLFRARKVAAASQVNPSQ